MSKKPKVELIVEITVPCEISIPKQNEYMLNKNADESYVYI